MLNEEMNKQGNWLFRYRSYLPLILVLVAVAAMSQGESLERWDTVEEIFCVLAVVVSLAGLVVRIKTVGHVPSRTSGRNTKNQIADTLNTTGMYSVVRHPLYFGNFLMWLGIVMLTQNWWFILFFLVAYALYYERIMQAEEAFLRRKFGESFEAWCEKTPAFWPRWRQWKPSNLPFSTRFVLRREYSGLLAMVLGFVFVEVVGDAFEEGHLKLDLGWGIALGVALVVYIVLRSLKKAKKLDVEGR